MKFDDVCVVRVLSSIDEVDDNKNINMTDNEVVKLLQTYGLEEQLHVKDSKLMKTIICSRCKKQSNYGNLALLYHPGPILHLGCSECNINWHMCVVCTSRLSRTQLLPAHLESKKHKQNQQLYRHNEQQQCEQQQCLEVVPSVPVLITVPPANKTSKSTKPLHVLALEKLFSQEPLAEGEDLICAFSAHCKDIQEAMLYFHVAGLAGKHGGVRFLVANAFSHGACMSSERMASIQESFWQFQSFVQYVSMSAEQRKDRA